MRREHPRSCGESPDSFATNIYKGSDCSPGFNKAVCAASLGQHFPSASIVRSGTKVNGNPVETICIGRSSRMSAAAIPSAFATRAIDPLRAELRLAMHHPDKIRLAAGTLIVTVTGPIPSCNVVSTFADLGAISPRLASTHAVPTVGCPAIGSSRLGVKILTRRAARDVQQPSRTSIAEVRQCAPACISLALSGQRRSKPATLIPPKGREAEDIDEG